MKLFHISAVFLSQGTLHFMSRLSQGESSEQAGEQAIRGWFAGFGAGCSLVGPPCVDDMTEFVQLWVADDRGPLGCAPGTWPKVPWSGDQWSKAPRF